MHTPTALTGPMVDTNWLSTELGKSNLRLLDATWTWAGSDARPDDAFATEHISGARYFDHQAVADSQSPYTDTRPSAEEFAQHVGALGITPADTVVVYSQRGTAGGASRAWWLFRSFGHENVFVLDGGLPRWKTEERPLASGPPAPCDACSYNARSRTDLVIDVDALRAQIDSSPQIVDARSAKLFAGQGVFPAANPKVSDLEPGRIPNSVNMPSASFVDSETKTLKSEQALREIFEAGGVKLDEPIVTTCSLGIGACTAALALAAAGATRVVVFDGAWQVWGSDPSTPKDKGD